MNSVIFENIEIVIQRKILLFIVITLLFLVGSLSSSTLIGIPIFSEQLSLPRSPEVFADHGQEILLILNSGSFTPLTIDKGNQVKVLVNYTTNNSTIIDNTINAVMKIYALNRTAIKSTSFPNGFNTSSSGTQEIKTTIMDNQTKNLTAVVQLTDATKIVPLSNPVHIRLNLTQPFTATSENATTPEIAAFFP
jgi:hypothetical protein